MASYGNYGNYGNASYGNGNANNDYSTTSYGGQGGAGGGGFMGGSQPQGSQGGAKQQGKESLRPCTILQAISAPDPDSAGDFRIDGHEVGHVHIVGQIRNIAKQTTNVTYVLDDGTGTMDVKVWIDAEKPTEDDMGNLLPQPLSEQGLEIGKWAKCIGKLKQFNQKRHVGANAIRAMRDMNEINYHLLEATAIHLYFTKGAPGGPRGGGGAGGAMEQEGGGLFVQQDGGAADRSMNGFSPTAKAIVSFLRDAPENNEGYNAQHISAALKVPYVEVLKAGDELLTGSVTYTTTDDHTWALLE